MATLKPKELLRTEIGKLVANAVLFNERVAVNVGMSSSEMQTIHLLQLHGPLTPGDLARFTGLQTGSMTAVLDKLEKLTFISRRSHPSDRRKVVIEADGTQIRKVFAPYYKSRAAHTNATLKALSDEEVEVVLRFLRLLNSNVS